jgi:hypothetical protein
MGQTASTLKRWNHLSIPCQRKSELLGATPTWLDTEELVTVRWNQLEEFRSWG